ncbi:MAG: M1 family aminopeptidase, partial [Longimicrobiales bacterium]|nr:M1 family aminopeptidase [Longimicrobiales bacterium]
AAVVLWVRGVDTSAGVRRRNAGLRIRQGAGRALALSALAWLVVAAWVFHNTQVLNAYPPTREVEAAQVAYETRYKAAWSGVPQPRALTLEYAIDIFPEERDLFARGTSLWMNKSDAAIDTIFVNLSRQVTMALEIPGATLAREDAETNVHFYALDPALQPGDTVTVTWTAEYRTRGFENQVAVTQISPNGTFFNNGFITPSLGYEPAREMADRNERRKRGLPERPRMPELTRDCVERCRNNYISDDADWVTFETVISTSPDQIAVAPGTLEAEWEADGRRHFRYVLDHPSLPFASFISARYQVARETWQGVDVEVYHHPQHTYNVEKMLRAIRRSLDYNQEHFGPYRHGQARIIEFPRYATFAQAFPGTMPYSEAIGFIARIEDEEDIDFVFYVVAHEMAHQWWAHQVIGAEVEGATVLSETLAQYSALMTMEREYGREKIHRFLRYEMDNYLRSRGAETLQEKPLLRVDESQGYVHYRKGSVVLYYLKEMLGEDVLNAALRSLVDEFAYAGPPYPTSHALLDRIRAVTPDSLQALVTDLFEHITLYDNRVVGEPEVEALEDGRWRVRYNVLATKVRADSVGAETEVVMDDYVELAVLAEPAAGEERGRVLARDHRRLAGGTHTVTFEVDERPWQVAIDPDYLLIDRVPDDNVKRVRAGGR